MLYDARSNKSAQGGEALGYDGNKKVHGRKHQLAVDSQGFLLGVLAHPANESDSRSSLPLIRESVADWSTLQRAHVDHGYAGDATRLLEDLGLVAVLPPKQGKGFAVQPLRWKVERSIAWLKNHRRLCSDFERTTRSTEAFIWLAGLVVKLRRLCRESVVWKNRRKD